MRVSAIQLPFGAGDRVVYETGLTGYDSPRHVGRVEAVFNTLLVKVSWPNGWVSEDHARYFTRAPQEA